MVYKCHTSLSAVLDSVRSIADIWTALSQEKFLEGLGFCPICEILFKNADPNGPGWAELANSY